MSVSLQNVGIRYGKLPIRSLRDIICNKNPWPKLYFKYRSSLKNLLMTKLFILDVFLLEDHRRTYVSMRYPCTFILTWFRET